MNEAENLAITKYDLFYESRMTKIETLGQVEPRLTRVEVAVESLKNDMREIKIDLRWMLGLMISFSTIMIGIMAKGFHWL